MLLGSLQRNYQHKQSIVFAVVGEFVLDVFGAFGGGGGEVRELDADIDRWPDQTALGPLVQFV